MSTFQFVCDLIILLGGVFAAIKLICEGMGKPIVFFKKKKDKKRAEELQTVVDKVGHEVKESIKPLFKNLEDQNKAQSQQLSRLTQSSRDLLRQDIIEIYERNKTNKVLSLTERLTLKKLYGDYRRIRGNGDIELIYNLMKDWEVNLNDANPALIAYYHKNEEEFREYEENTDKEEWE